MAKKKKVEKVIKLQIEAGKANPAPPVGPALGAAGVNIMDFCKQFNAASQSEKGNILPVEIEVYSDRSFTFVLKKPPMARLLLKEAGIDKGSAEPNKDKVARMTPEQVKKVAAIKMVDLNARTPEAAFNIAAGTARSMGIEVEEA